LQKENSAKISSHAGKIIGGMIGDALGNKIGYLAGNIAFEHVEKFISRITMNQKRIMKQCSRSSKKTAW